MDDEIWGQTDSLLDDKNQEPKANKQTEIRQAASRMEEEEIQKVSLDILLGFGLAVVPTGRGCGEKKARGSQAGERDLGEVETA